MLLLAQRCLCFNKLLNKQFLRLKNEVIFCHFKGGDYFSYQSHAEQDIIQSFMPLILCFQAELLTPHQTQSGVWSDTDNFPRAALHLEDLQVDAGMEAGLAVGLRNDSKYFS